MLTSRKERVHSCGRLTHRAAITRMDFRLTHAPPSNLPTPQAALHHVAGRALPRDQPHGDRGEDIPGDRAGRESDPEHHRAAAALRGGKQDPGEFHGHAHGERKRELAGAGADAGCVCGERRVLSEASLSRACGCCCRCCGWWWWWWQ